ncbi:uncharacterized protein MONBRDRAFT_6361, partial [Monosiga brevicollis MX1]
MADVSEPGPEDSASPLQGEPSEPLPEVAVTDANEPIEEGTGDANGGHAVGADVPDSGEISALNVDTDTDAAADAGMNDSDEAGDHPNVNAGVNDDADVDVDANMDGDVDEDVDVNDAADADADDAAGADDAADAMAEDAANAGVSIMVDEEANMDEDGEQDDDDDLSFDPFPSLSNDEFATRLEELRLQLHEVDRENYILDRAWVKAEADMREKSAAPKAPSAKPTATRNPKRRSRMRPASSTTETAEPQIPVSLTDAQLAELARREVDQLQSEYDEDHARMDKALADLQAELFDLQEQVREIPGQIDLFQHDVAATAATTRSGKVETETLQRFYEVQSQVCGRCRGLRIMFRCFPARLGSRSFCRTLAPHGRGGPQALETTVDKLQLKANSLRQQQRRVAEHLRHKEEYGGVLHQVDFEQLRIENSQQNTTLDTRSKELLNLKVTLSKTNQALTKQKDHLSQTERELAQVQAELKRRETLRQKIEAEFEQVTARNATLKKANDELKQEREDFKVPSVMDYVQEQAALPRLRANVRTLERKVELAQ